MLKSIGAVVVVLLLAGALWGAYGAYKTTVRQNNTDGVVSGAIRDNFIRGTNEGCTESLQQESKFTSDQVSSYCSCTSNKIADQITNSEVAVLDNGGTISAQLQSKIDAATNYCAQYLK
jgi:hypothetical protein